MQILTATAALINIASAAVISRDAALEMTNAKKKVMDASTEFIVQHPSSGCVWAPPAECAASFEYYGQTYTGCCTADSSSEGGWCSHSEAYTGGWSGCLWTCTDVPGEGTVVMPFANDWVPHADEVAYMQGQADSAESIRREMLKKQEDLQQALAEAQLGYSEQASVAAETQQKATIASALMGQEAKREAALPSLARMAQQEAVFEHKRRLDAEMKLAEVKKKRKDAQGTQGSSLVKIRQSITKQRFVNRIRAAEDARIADAAVKAAQQARFEMEQKAMITSRVNAAVEAALASRKDAAVLAGQVIINASAGLTGKVAAANANVATMDANVVMAAQALENLRAEAEESRTKALEAQQTAYEDRARVDAARLGSGLLKKVKNCEDIKLANQTDALNILEAQAASDSQKANASVASKKLVEQTALESQGKAIQRLKSATKTVSSQSATTKYAQKMSQLAPEAFVSGIANAIVGGKL